ncbi:MAG: hypothetical protein Q7T77_07535 [Sulfuricurvum sp.]|nr:hypothetical protein [Sulfuricurvum sp.]
MMKSIFIWTFIVSTTFFFTGCAHKIDIAPKLDTIRETKVEVFKSNVAYYLSDTDKQLEVITPGGGGDKVKYTPYADTEAALNAVLSNVFAKAYSIKALDDKKFIMDKNISYVFIPKIITTSSSENAFTWPPEKFTVELTCKAIDPASGNKILEITTSSVGIADFGDYRKDFSFSARMASEQAFLNMLTELSKNKILQEKGK